MIKNIFVRLASSITWLAMILSLIVTGFVITNYCIIQYDRYKYKAPGKFIEVNGKKIHYLYTG